MATLYYDAAVDNNWNTLGNWWQNSSFTVPATALPTSGDTTYLEADVTTGPVTAVTLAALFIAQAYDVVLSDSGAGISTTGDIISGQPLGPSGYILSSLTCGGAAYFKSESGNSGTIVGTATFEDSSKNFGLVSGNATFEDYSVNQGGSTVSGNATFRDNSANDDTVSGNATFEDNTTNYGTVSGDATFQDNSVNGGTVSGNATFEDNSFSYGTVSGNVSLYYPSPLPPGGIIGGTIYYYGYPPLYFNAAVDHGWNNASNWWKDSAFSEHAHMIPGNGNTAILEGDVTVGTSAAITLGALFIAQMYSGITISNAGAGISITGDVTVGRGIFYYGRIESVNLPIGETATFYGGKGGNSGTIAVDQAVFYLGSSNYGTSQGSASNGAITGNAIFHDGAKNYCSIDGNASFYDISSNNGSAANITGDATFNDSSYNASGATVTGDAIFRNSSYNSGTVTGNATVYYPVARPLGGTVMGTITYIGYP